MTTYAPGPFARPFSSPLSSRKGWWSDALNLGGVDATPEALSEWWDAACVGYAAQPDTVGTLLDVLAAPVDSPWTEGLTKTLLKLGDWAGDLVTLLDQVVPGRPEDGTSGWVGRLGHRGCGRPLGFVEVGGSWTPTRVPVEPAGLVLAAQMGNAPRLALALVVLGADPNARAIWDETPAPVPEGRTDPDYSWDDLARDVVASGPNAWDDPLCHEGVQNVLTDLGWEWTPPAMVAAFERQGLRVAPDFLGLPASQTTVRRSLHLCSQALMEATTSARTHQVRDGAHIELIDTDPCDHGTLLLRLIDLDVNLDVPVPNVERLTDPVDGVFFHNQRAGDPRLGDSHRVFVDGASGWSARDLLARLHEQRGQFWFTPPKTIGWAPGGMVDDALARLDDAFRSMEQQMLRATLRETGGAEGLDAKPRQRL